MMEGFFWAIGYWLLAFGLWVLATSFGLIISD
jgi:hypothetical protein